MISQSFSQSVCESLSLSSYISLKLVSQSVSQSVSIWVSQSFGELVSQLCIYESVCLSVSLWVSQSVSRSVSQSVSQSVGQLVSQSVSPRSLSFSHFFQILIFRSFSHKNSGVLIGGWIVWPIPQSITLKYRKDTKRKEQIKAHCNKPVFFEMVITFFVCFLFIDYTPCGVSHDDLRARVVGGKNSKRGCWPWQIGLRRVNSKGWKICVV